MFYDPERLKLRLSFMFKTITVYTKCRLHLFALNIKYKDSLGLKQWAFYFHFHINEFC